MRKLSTLAIFLSVIIIGCQSPETTTETDVVVENPNAAIREQAQRMFGTLPAIADNPNNELTDAKIKLGHMLYFDKVLSKGQTQSCNTCHNLSTYGVDNLPTSPGDNGTLGTRNSPTVFNAGLHFKQFWDGREPDVEAQAGGPVLNPIEMGMPDEAQVVERLSKIDQYKTLFAEAFPGEEPAITYDNMKKAIGAFERKLITPSPFDQFLAGDDKAMSEQAIKGMDTFIKVGCTTCHMGNVLGGNMMQKFGLFADYWTLTNSKVIDNGLYELTKNESDKYIFKVPGLRNIEKTGPYFHDGSVAKLSDAVVIMAKTELNKDLTPEEVNDIVAFLNALTGEAPADLIKDPFVNAE
ncbi:MAG: cytochrome-c peroxidase [Bacteroidales bacterium]|nr:cytochrome-c peroxidase [Bacteroidales bacterium]